MAYGTINADVIGTSVANTSLGAGDASLMKNRIINGDMRIFQRATSVTSSGYFVDRWQYTASQTSKGTANQSSTAPAGFTNSIIFTSSSAYSITSGDYFVINQNVEGYNIADLGWGTASAKTVTVSFWVQSSLTGTFGASISNGGTRSYPFSYTISAANTWEQKSITITGDTTGTWATNNTNGLQVNFGIGVGSTYSGTAGAWASANYVSVTGATSVVGTNGATFYITGVQLEVGSSATGFEYVNYQTSLANCQRYYNKFLLADTVSPSLTRIAGFGYTTNLVLTYYQFPVLMRTYPTMSTTGTASNYQILQFGGGQTCTSVPSMGGYTACGGQITFTASGAVNTGQGSAGGASTTGSNIYLAFDAEL